MRFVHSPFPFGLKASDRTLFDLAGYSPTLFEAVGQILGPVTLAAIREQLLSTLARAPLD